MNDQWNCASSAVAVGQLERGAFTPQVSPPIATYVVSACRYGYSTDGFSYVPKSSALARKQSLW